MIPLGRTALPTALTLLLASDAAADVTMTVEQAGQDVVISGGGSFDLSSAIGSSTFAFAPAAEQTFVITGASAPTLIRNLALTGDFSGPLVIPGPSPAIFADEATGDMFGAEWSAGTQNVYVPVGYVDGAPLQGSMTFFNRTVDSMGFVPGESYTWTWDTITGTDSFTLTIVPAPGAAALFGLAGLVATRRRR